jgi:mRNA-degrading endonuclease HigB of HigAB toxin-antitoxin module
MATKKDYLRTAKEVYNHWDRIVIRVRGNEFTHIEFSFLILFVREVCEDQETLDDLERL